MGLEWEIHPLLTLLSSLLAGLILLLYRYFKSRKSLNLLFPPFFLLSSLSPGRKVRWSRHLTLLEWTGVSFLLLALASPRLFIPLYDFSTPPLFSESREGYAIYLLLDRSGSMQESIYSLEEGKWVAKIDLLKETTEQFVLGHPAVGLPGRGNDLVGVIAFARLPEVLSPLTIDHRAVKESLISIQAVSDKRDDGTAIGYAIYKAAHLMGYTYHEASMHRAEEREPIYKIHSMAIILVTDGVQEIHPLDRDNPLRNVDIPQAAAYAKEQGIHLYIINLNPGIPQEEFSPFQKQLEAAASSTGGKFFMMEGGSSLRALYREIDLMEKSLLPWPQHWIAQNREGRSRDQLPHLFFRYPLYLNLIGLGLFFLWWSFLLKSTWMRRVP